jgi:beta-lactamase class A
MGVLLFGSVVVAQWLYPNDRTLPFAVIDGKQVGSEQRDVLLSELQDRYGKQVEFKAGEKILTKALLIDAGIIPQYEMVVKKALEYPWWERSIPFSLLTRQWSMGAIPMEFTYSVPRAEAFAKSQLIPRCNAEAVGASIVVQKGELVLAAGKEGRLCDVEGVIAALQNTKPQTQTVQLPYQVLYPQRKNNEVKRLFEHTKQRFAEGLAIEVDGTIYKVDAKTVISWLSFHEDKKTHQLKLAINDGRARTYLEKLQKKYYKAPTARTVYLLDGAERRQQAGTEGRTIAIEATMTTLKKSLMQSGGVVQATMQTVVPQTQYVNDYSVASQGLQALLQNLAREKGDYGITVIELDGRKRSANANGTRIYTTASTYKIFVAYAVLKEIEAGRIRWGQIIRDNMTTEDCWAEMLIYSMNPCSWVFADMAGGWGRLEQLARGYGMVNTQLTANDKHSTSNDESLYFAKLEQGQLLQGASRQRLLDTLKVQHYRSGIPTGTGYVVADKIGFLDGYLHDVGIVYAPKGRYVLGVMTYGGSWGQIADVARRVNEYMQR